MKRFNIYLLTIIISSLFFTKAYAQGEGIVTKDIDEENVYVFWFYVRSEVKVDRVTKRPAYSVRVLGTKPKSGNLKKFDKDVWRCLLGGQQIAIGPFKEYTDAIRAIEMYDLKKKDSDINFRDSTVRDTYYWYLLEYTITKRKHKFQLKRVPARVASGDLQSFRAILKESLTAQKLTVGPFGDPTEAEESKRRYRIEEN